MKILRIIPSVNPQDGGPIAGILNTAHEMKEVGGHTTEIVCHDLPDSPWLSDFPFKVHALGPIHKKYGRHTKLSSWIAENGKFYDAAVLHGLWNHASIRGWQGLREAKLPYVVYTHGMLDPWFRKKYPVKHILKQMAWAVQGRALRDAHSVLFTSAEEEKLSRRVFWGFKYDSRVVAYGVSNPPSVKEANRAAFQDVYPGIGDRSYILFLSRIHPKKGVDLLIEAYGSIIKGMETPSDFPDLVIAGPDALDMKPKLSKKAESLGVADRIHWPGMISGKAKFGAFRASEVFILPSHQENFGQVVAEALACNVPVLTTDKVNIWREIVNAGAGLAEPDTLEGITRLLVRWKALGKEEQDQMRQEARPCYDRHFTISAASQDLTDILREAVATSEVKTLK
ncbi:glycosyltransferase [Albibacillus kandeliae]|uniref:glycosyltransferase n=1 Tax=Albibacillus kandeliae TaxID=2174228 RepID=UPI000D692099|nr:glycosyltransferase [Albibacillus kandeliae]